jgi:predicted aspartyl protease
MVEIADGSIVECEEWKVPELNVGNQTLKNLTVSVVDSEDSMLLFGMDGLNKLNVLKMNLIENEIILNRE